MYDKNIYASEEEAARQEVENIKEAAAHKKRMSQLEEEKYNALALEKGEPTFQDRLGEVDRKHLNISIRNRLSWIVFFVLATFSLIFLLADCRKHRSLAEIEKEAKRAEYALSQLNVKKNAKELELRRISNKLNRIIDEKTRRIKSIKPKVVVKWRVRVVKEPVEKIVYKDRIIEKPVEKIVYRDRIKTVDAGENSRYKILSKKFSTCVGYLKSTSSSLQSCKQHKKHLEKSCQVRIGGSGSYTSGRTLRVGMTKSEVMSLLGPPEDTSEGSYGNDRTWVYRKRTICKSYSSCLVSFKNGAMISIDDDFLPHLKPL